jgi:hypothetical protein
LRWLIGEELDVVELRCFLELTEQPSLQDDDNSKPRRDRRQPVERKQHQRWWRWWLRLLRLRVLLALAAAVALSGCASSASRPSARQALEAYVARVEPVRLQVNRLLNRADPTLSAYGDHRLSGAEAQHRMDALERRFANYAVKISALPSVPAAIRAAHNAYAHTYVLEDAYLSALVAALPGREFGDLPHTQNQQRRAIIAWRIRLQVLANRLGLQLPSELQSAGRGEIAPSPSGS